MADNFKEIYDAFRDWAVKRFGWWAVTSQAKFSFNEFQNSAEYQEWMKAGAPGYGTKAEREAEAEVTTVGGIRKSVTPSGAIPWKGNQTNQARLESLGYELIKSDEFGVLPEDSWFFQKKAEEPKPTTEVDLNTLPMVVPTSGQGFEEVWWDRATNTYYKQDALGKPVKITADDAVRMRNLYLKTSEAIETGLEPASAPTQSIAEQQWTTSKNRQEWAPGVNIEQDITTGKLYRPGSMVEVSPDIANQELLAYQKAQETAGKPDWAQGYNEAQLALEREKFAWTKEQAGSKPEEQRLRYELQWELDRQRLLGGLAPDDWITKYLTENMPNPYKQQANNPPEIGSLVSGLGSQLDRQTGQVQALEAIAVARGMGAGWDSEVYKKAEEEMVAAQTTRDATYQAWTTVKKEAENWSPQPSPQRQKYPFAPEWLPQWAPGQVAGREITPENVATPSGQQLTQMEPSLRNKLGYYADWTQKRGGGRRWQDIMAEADIMQPYTPAGAGRSRWSPSRQF